MTVCLYFMRSCPAFESTCLWHLKYVDGACVLQQCVLDSILTEVLKSFKIIFLILRLQILNVT